MKEIEILYNLKEGTRESSEKIKNFSFENGEKFNFVGKKRVIDTYYKSTTFSDLDPDENQKLFSSLRIREKEGVNYITHKHDNFDIDNIWIYSDELEVKIEDVDIMKKILSALHFEELVKIDNIKQIFESGSYEIVLEKVENLGNFIEIEYKSGDEVKEENILDIKEKIRDLVKKLGISIGEELNAGKPELMLNKL